MIQDFTYVPERKALVNPLKRGQTNEKGLQFWGYTPRCLTPKGDWNPEYALDEIWLEPEAFSLRSYEHQFLVDSFRRRVCLYPFEDLHRAADEVRQSFIKALKSDHFTGYGESWAEDILGCSISDLHSWLENLFPKDQPRWLFRPWKFDFLIPVQFARTGEELVHLLHHTNLVPWVICGKKHKNRKLPTSVPDYLNPSIRLIWERNI